MTNGLNSGAPDKKNLICHASRNLKPLQNLTQTTSKSQRQRPSALASKPGNCLLINSSGDKEARLGSHASLASTNNHWQPTVVDLLPDGQRPVPRNQGLRDYCYDPDCSTDSYDSDSCTDCCDSDSCTDCYDSDESDSCSGDSEAAPKPGLSSSVARAPLKERAPVARLKKSKAKPVKPARVAVAVKPPTSQTAPKVRLDREALAERSQFLKSLSDDPRCHHPSTTHFHQQFFQNRDVLVEKLFVIFNETVFDNKLPRNLSIRWNTRLTATAGLMDCLGDHRTRTASVQLASKVLDCPERVRDTLLHELCHVVCYLVHGHQEDNHGPLFQQWGRKACHVYPFLPEVSSCHDYDIKTRYSYQCTRCSVKIDRHSKSLDTKRRACDYCGGRFVLLQNEP